VREGKDAIEVSGERLEPSEHVYWMMNKPRGLVTTASDEQGRATVFSLLPPGSKHISAVGRLDKASEGLLLFTNDTLWAARITDPASRIRKLYHVQIGVVADDALLRKLARGDYAADSVKLLRFGGKNSWLEIELTEGKNRQIRRMFDAFDIEVLRLIRVQIGALELGKLANGKWRELSPQEVSGLLGSAGKAAVSLASSQRRRTSP
jgi:23S rRNA pseudouridine2605 synthase